MTFLALKSDHVMAWDCMVGTCAKHLFGASQSIWKGYLVSYFSPKALKVWENLKKNQYTQVGFEPPSHLVWGISIRDLANWAMEALLTNWWLFVKMSIRVIECLKYQILGKIKLPGYPMLVSLCALRVLIHDTNTWLCLYLGADVYQFLS